MIIPNFLIIGAQKAGTTSLYYYLNQHPQIYMSYVKEPRFFAPEFYTAPNKVRPPKRKSPLTWEEYCYLFKDVSNEIAIGEASTDYLHLSKAPERIKKTIPEVKLIVILRNPVERAFSAYCYQVRDGYENLSFAEAIKEEEKGTRDYKKLGFYYSQLKRYYDIFDRSQIKIYLNEDLNSNPDLVLQDIFRFLGVNCEFQPEYTKKNISGVPKNRFLHNIFLKENIIKETLKPLFSKELRQLIHSTVRKHNLRNKPAFPVEKRHKLIETYREDILKLQDLIQQDLSHWLE